MFWHFLRKTPYAAIIETSNTCNFQCPTCPTPHKLIYKRRPPEFMGFEKFKKIIDNIKNNVHVVYLFNSNEPLLHPKIVEMIKYASSNNLHTMISTNASLLDKEKSKAILNSGLGEIRFALDGLDKESYEVFRVGGNFEQVLVNIKNFCHLKQKLKKHRPLITLQFILNKYNQDQIPAIKKFARELKVNKLYIKPFVLSEYAYSKEEIKDLAERFFPTKDIYDDEIVYKKEEKYLVPKKKLKNCRAVNNVFTVLSNSKMVMCCFDLFGDYSYGDISQRKLKDIWFSQKVKKMRKIASQRGFPLCQKCANIE